LEPEVREFLREVKKEVAAEEGGSAMKAFRR